MMAGWLRLLPLCSHQTPQYCLSLFIQLSVMIMCMSYDVL